MLKNFNEKIYQRMLKNFNKKFYLRMLKNFNKKIYHFSRKKSSNYFAISE